MFEHAADRASLNNPAPPARRLKLMQATLARTLSSSGRAHVKFSSLGGRKYYKALRAPNGGIGRTLQNSVWRHIQVNVKTTAIGLHVTQTDAPALVFTDPLDQ
jgi:hypothetical protein